ncbi:hypothetical protein NC652_029156 [Populus alba x Populus x berolinensis]|nr:hypothetical protein NC652_029156 [Populus alba x Populus x berolinensis]
MLTLQNQAHKRLPWFLILRTQQPKRTCANPSVTRPFAVYNMQVRTCLRGMFILLTYKNYMEHDPYVQMDDSSTSDVVSRSWKLLDPPKARRNDLYGNAKTVSQEFVFRVNVISYQAATAWLSS